MQKTTSVTMCVMPVKKVHSEEEVNWIQCDVCLRFFRGEQFFDLHKKTTAEGNSTCQNIYRCTDCGWTVSEKLDRNHKCGQMYCEKCRNFSRRSPMLQKPEQKIFTETMSIELMDEE